MAKVRLLFLILILPAVFALPEIFVKQPAGREIAVTVDDLPGVKTGGDRAADAIRVNRSIVRVLKKQRVPALGFVNGQRAFPDDPGATARILRIWTDAGMELGNHTARHSSLHQVSVEAFKADVRDGLAMLEEKNGPQGASGQVFPPTLPAYRPKPRGPGRDRRPAQGDRPDGRPGDFRQRRVDLCRGLSQAVLGGDGKQRRIAAYYLDYMTRKLAYFEDQSRSSSDGRSPDHADPCQPAECRSSGRSSRHTGKARLQVRLPRSGPERQRV